ncbi:MAG: ABC transporter transmembrane domain-containing protein [Bacteroidota bacterium]
MAKRGGFNNNEKQIEVGKAPINKETLSEALALFSYLRPYRFKFIWGLVFIALSAISTLAFPILLGKMIDAASPGLSNELPNGNNPIQQSIGFDLKSVQLGLNTILVLIFVQLTLQTVFSFMRIYLFTEVGEKSLADMRKDLYTKLLTMPMSFYTEQRVGELSSRISSDLSQIQDAISLTLAEFLRGLFTLVVGLSVIFIISSKLAFAMLAVVPVIAVLAVVFGLRIRKMSRKAQDQLAESGTIVNETFQGIAIVKAFSSEANEIKRYTKSIFGVVDTAISNARYRGAFVSFMIFSVFGAIAFVMWIGANMIKTGDLTIGDLTMFVIISGFVGGTFAGFADMFSQLQKTLGATQRVRELMREKGEDVAIVETAVDTKYKLEGAVEFKNVAFAYPSRLDVTVLNNINLVANIGQQIALVGPSGAGKSTIASLLLQFYKATEGNIFYDGKNVNEIPLSQLRKQLAYVPQDVMLFGGTLYENIAYGNPLANEAEVIEAAKKANALDFIMAFPDKMQTIVGERGIKLSGGQRQRIAIARAILKNPAILILDEATSALDSESESLVQEALDNLMRDRTTFVIAHRLSTIRKADKILLIDKGVVAEQGTHDDLIKNEKGVYRKLVELQIDSF